MDEQPPPSAHDSVTLDEVLPEVYSTLRGMAARLWRTRQPDSSVHPTMLVHEVYLRLSRDPARLWNGRAHVIAVAARAMRMVLADRARSRRALKRFDPGGRVTLTDLGRPDDPVPVIALDAALAELEQLSPRRAQVFVLRALGGLGVEEIATITGTSPRTVKSDWQFARAWVASQLDVAAAPPE